MGLEEKVKYNFEINQCVVLKVLTIDRRPTNLLNIICAIME